MGASWNVLSITLWKFNEAFELADLYQESGILTSNFYDDGLHTALATLAEVDLLVSWNFRHIVHYDKIRRFNTVNLEQGYKSLTIYSPREVARYFFENEMLIQLNIMAARVMDRPIPSVYGNEASALRIVDSSLRLAHNEHYAPPLSMLFIGFPRI